MSSTLREKVRSGLLWSAILNWSVRLSALLLFMVMTRWLSPAQLGLFAAATVVLSFLSMLAEQGLSEAVIQRAEISQQQMNSVFWLNFGAAILMLCVLWIAAPFVAAAMKLPELTDILRVSALSLPITASSFGQLAMRKRQFDYRSLAKPVWISTVASMSVALAVLFAGFGVWSLVAQSLVATAVLTGMLWLKPGWKLTTETDFRATRPMMSYGAKRVGTYLLEFCNSRYIEVFLASTLGPASLGLYAVGIKLHQALMHVFNSMVLEVAHNGYSRLASDRTALVNAYYQSVTATATIVIPAFILIAATAPSLSGNLFGAQWADSAEVMRLMALLGAFQVLEFNNNVVFNALGRPGIALWLMIIKVLISLSALHLSKDASFQILLYAYAASQILTGPISFWLVRTAVKIPLMEVARRIWPFLFASSLMYAFAAGGGWYLDFHGLPALIITPIVGAAGILIYLAILRAIAPSALSNSLQFIRPQTAKTASI